MLVSQRAKYRPVAVQVTVHHQTRPHLPLSIIQMFEMFSPARSLPIFPSGLAFVLVQDEWLLTISRLFQNSYAHEH